jgi:hypothetical protein
LPTTTHNLDVLFLPYSDDEYAAKDIQPKAPPIAWQSIMFVGLLAKYHFLKRVQDTNIDTNKVLQAHCLSLVKLSTLWTFALAQVMPYYVLVLRLYIA